MVEFVLDNRERKLIELVSDENLSIAALDIGDFQIKTKSGELLLIIERKTIPDLAASLRDGRYNEQKQRLKAACDKVIYLIEGKVQLNDESSFEIRNVNNKSLVSCMINLSLRDGFFVYNTASTEETASFIKGVMTRYKKDPEMYMIPVNADPNQPNNYVPTSSVKIRKRDNIDVEQCFLLQLCAIPGISVKKGRAIISHLQVKNMDEFMNSLTNIKILEGCPGIGKILAKTVYSYLKEK